MNQKSVDIPNYSSSQNEDLPITQPISLTKKKDQDTIGFNNHDEAVKSIEKEWGFWYSNSTSTGKKAYYRCNKSKLREKQCESRLLIHYPSDNLEVHIYKTSVEHTHVMHENKMSTEVVDKIKQLFDLQIKPNAILEALRTAQLPMPKKSILIRHLRKLRKEKFGETIINLSELENWCKNNSKIPSSIHEPYVSSFYINYGDDGNTIWIKL